MTFQQIITDIGAGIAAIGAIATVLAHLPFLPAKYAEFFARISSYAANWKFSVNQRDTLPPGDGAPVAAKPARMFPSDPPLPPNLAGIGALLLAVCFALCSTGCADLKPIVKDIDTAAVILCDVFFSEQPQNVSLSPADVEKAFCSTAEQIAPFLDSAKKAVGRGGAIRMAKDPQ